MTSKSQTLVLMLMTCAWNVEVNAFLKRRLNTLETRVNSIEMRINTDNELTRSTLTSMRQDVEALNTSIVILEDQACVCSNEREENDKQIKKNLGQSVVVSHQRETLIKKGFMDEKKWLRKKVKVIENEMRKVANQVESNDDIIAETVTRMQVKENDLDRKLTEVISEVMAKCSAEIRKKDEKMDRQQAEIDDLKQMINEMKEVPDNLPCPDGWTKFQSFCYLYVEEKMNYVSARETCLKLGASVADIQSSPENEFVYKLCENNGHTWTRSSLKRNVWLGLTDEETEGVWISDRTREKSTYMNWNPGEPDDSPYQNCLTMGFEAPFDQWNDIYCESTIGLQAQFVCKKEI
ncbi:low affinity immunoglobulin epsilon Fc receptor-like [Mercenaria mercenaria]|uniref:low affinity immunoglobulin epsilon Fc receptor-like n=1 Tax=Mercenaria mercenaria TaxID=6596 RepID=UPI00234E9957|nr:low affinity immunoglobulin epsilon Fc receptor-like [Mercenaria mercenaria]